MSKVLIEPDAILERIRQAYLAGCEAVQANYQPDPDPEFGEASYDYVASLDFTEDTRPISDGWQDIASGPKTMTLNLTADEIAALEKLADAEIPLWQIISSLRADEGDSVTLLCDNPEGPPNNAIECCGMWTAWIDRRFEGETLAAALAAAYRARRATEAASNDKGAGA